MRKFFIRAFAKSIGVALFIIILIRLDWGRLLKSLFGAESGDFLYLLVALLLAFPLLITKSFRWRLILENLNIKISGREALRYYTIGLFAASATPGQLGDFVKIIYLNKQGHPGGASFFGVLYDRIFDIIALGFVFLSGLAFLSGEKVSKPLLVGIGAATIMFMISFLLSARLRKFLIIDIFRHLLPSGIKRRMKQYAVSIQPEEAQLSTKVMFLSFCLTIAAYSIIFYRYYLLLLTLNIFPQFAVWFGAVALSSFVTLLPISISGVGTRDAILIIAFGSINIAAEVAVAFSLLILLLMVFNGILGLTLWMKHPLVPKRGMNL